MGSVSLSDIPDIWRNFLIDREFAKNYTMGYIDLPGPVPKNPVVERLLPSLLQIKAVTILDSALKALIDDKKLTVPKKPYGTDLKGRIDFLADQGFLTDRKALHSIRDTRNEVAHEPEKEVAWPRFDQDVNIINSALRELGLVGELPQWNVITERSKAKDGEIAGAIISFRYRISIKEGESLVAEISWRNHIMGDKTSTD